MESICLSWLGFNEEYNRTVAELSPQPSSSFGGVSEFKPVFCNKKPTYTTGVIVTL